MCSRCMEEVRLASQLRGDSASVDVDHLPVDDLATGRSQKAGAAGDVLGSAPATEQRFLHRALLPVFGGLVAPGGANPTRGQAVDADLRRQRLGQTAGE